jgi:hypothetical protein
VSSDSYPVSHKQKGSSAEALLPHRPNKLGVAPMPVSVSHDYDQKVGSWSDASEHGFVDNPGRIEQNPVMDHRNRRLKYNWTGVPQQTKDRKHTFPRLLLVQHQLPKNRQ